MMQEMLKDQIPIKSPLNYIGGKTKVLPQILPLFPKKLNNFVDLFAGGCNVGINVKADTLYINDNLTFLVDMLTAFRENDLSDTIKHIEKRIKKFELSSSNEEGFKAMRTFYNEKKHPLDLFVLIAYSFNHQIRFNNSHEYNNPFGRARSSFNATMKKNLEIFITALQEKDVVISNSCFTDFDYSFLGKDDLVYCDPPYLITTGSYNDGKRGFKGWAKEEELQLLALLDKLHKRKIKFALSNVVEHKGNSNEILKSWVNANPAYNINNLNFNYSNSSYQTLVRDKNATKEVVITNYKV